MKESVLTFFSVLIFFGVTSQAADVDGKFPIVGRQVRPICGTAMALMDTGNEDPWITFSGTREVVYVEKTVWDSIARSDFRCICADVETVTRQVTAGIQETGMQPILSHRTSAVSSFNACPVGSAAAAKTLADQQESHCTDPDWTSIPSGAPNRSCECVKQRKICNY